MKFDNMISQYNVLNDVEKIYVADAALNITLAMRISEKLKDNMVCMAHVLNTAQKSAERRRVSKRRRMSSSKNKTECLENWPMKN